MNIQQKYNDIQKEKKELIKDRQNSVKDKKDNDDKKIIDKLENDLLNLKNI